MIVTPDFLDTLNLSGPEHTSLLGTVTALYDVGCFFGAVYVLLAPDFGRFDTQDTYVLGVQNCVHVSRLETLS